MSKTAKRTPAGLLLPFFGGRRP